jgi:hypothetical protein
MEINKQESRIWPMVIGEYMIHIGFVRSWVFSIMFKLMIGTLWPAELNPWPAGKYRRVVDCAISAEEACENLEISYLKIRLFDKPFHFCREIQFMS